MARDVFSACLSLSRRRSSNLTTHNQPKFRFFVDTSARLRHRPVAYDAYLRGLAYSLKAQNSPANSVGARKHLREAVRLDPKFALSWALQHHVIDWCASRNRLPRSRPHTTADRMAAHRKSDRRRDDLCAVGLRKRASLIASAMRHSITERRTR